MFRKKNILLLWIYGNWFFLISLFSWHVFQGHWAYFPKANVKFLVTLKKRNQQLKKWLPLKVWLWQASRNCGKLFDAKFWWRPEIFNFFSFCLIKYLLSQYTFSISQITLCNFRKLCSFYISKLQCYFWTNSGQWRQFWQYCKRQKLLQ